MFVCTHTNASFTLLAVCPTVKSFTRLPSKSPHFVGGNTPALHQTFQVHMRPCGRVAKLSIPHLTLCGHITPKDDLSTMLCTPWITPLVVVARNSYALVRIHLYMSMVRFFKILRLL